LKIWRQEPVRGVGTGSFETYFRDQLTPSEQRKIRVVVSHNTPITVLSELGLVGFALFSMLGLWTGVWLRRRSRTPGPEGWAAWTAGAMLAGIFVHSLFYSGFFEDPYVWVLTAAAVALVGVAARPVASPSAVGVE
jgi:O-antigen ligase